MGSLLTAVFFSLIRLNRRNTSWWKERRGTENLTRYGVSKQLLGNNFSFCIEGTLPGFSAQKPTLFFFFKPCIVCNNIDYSYSFLATLAAWLKGAYRLSAALNTFFPTEIHLIDSFDWGPIWKHYLWYTCYYYVVLGPVGPFHWRRFMLQLCCIHVTTTSIYWRGPETSGWLDEWT